MPLSPSVEDILTPCYGHVGVFGKTFMPETFSQPYRALHDAMHRALDGPWQKVVIAAPRGVGKTSTVCGKAIERILFREINFLLYVRRSESLAIMQTENIKRELLTNTEIRKVFGNVKIDQDDPEGVDETFSKHSWTAFGNTLVLPRGKGQPVRGVIWKNYRWDLAIVDDLEDRRELENPEIRRQDKEWFYSDLMRGMDRYSKKWKLIYIDTLKHSESLLQELLDDPDWYAIRLQMFDDEYHSHVPEMFTDDDIKKEVESARRNGTLDILYMELQNVPVSKENASFRAEYFKYYDEHDVVVDETFVILDPAKTVQVQNADTAILAVGVNYTSGAMFVRDVVSGKMYPEQMYKEFFDMCRRYRVHTAGVEITGLEEFIKQPLTNYMRTLPPQYHVQVEWLKARGGDPGGEKGKIKRISALVPYYRQGIIYHNKGCCAKLEAQLLSFPRSGLVDCADCEAYIIELLELGERYFTEPTREASLDDDMELIEYDEFAEIEYDPPTRGNWRIL